MSERPHHAQIIVTKFTPSGNISVDAMVWNPERGVKSKPTVHVGMASSESGAKGLVAKARSKLIEKGIAPANIKVRRRSREGRGLTR